MRWSAFFGVWFIILVVIFGVYSFDKSNDRRNLIRECVVEEWERAGDNPGAIMVGVKDYCKAKVAIERGW